MTDAARTAERSPAGGSDDQGTGLAKARQAPESYHVSLADSLDRTTGQDEAGIDLAQVDPSGAWRQILRYAPPVTRYCRKWLLLEQCTRTLKAGGGDRDQRWIAQGGHKRYDRGGQNDMQRCWQAAPRPRVQMLLVAFLATEYFLRGSY